ncbi:MAG: glycosyltransferase family 39 protein [Elusimicrobia bacterium]|nr:glycosyltransferase family 39 protein [Elusimicrobiota bacterium]
MPKQKQRTAISPTGEPTTSPSPWLTAAALLWATFVFIVHLRFYSEKIPVGFSLYCNQLPAEFTIGPNFASFWFGHLLRMGGCFLLFLGAWSLGDALLLWFFPDYDYTGLGPLRVVFSLGLGLGVLAYLAFGLFALGIAHRGVYFGLYGMLCLFGICRLIPALRSSVGPPSDKTPDSPPNTTEKIVGGFLLVALAFSFLGTTQPEIFYDALVYHLAVPQTYLFAGRLVNMPYNHYSYLPLLTSMLYSWGLAIDGMYFAKLINFGVGFCTLIAIYRWGRVLKDRTLGLVACAIFLGTPLVIYLFWVTNSDLATAFFLLQTLMAAWSWLQDPEKNRKMLYLAGLFAGLGLASKYTAVFGVSILSFFIAWTFWKKRETLRVRAFLFYLTLIILPLAPWWARNYVYTGNPFFPYLADTLGPKGTDLNLMRGWQDETKDASPGFRPVLHVKKMWDDATTGVANIAFNYIGPLFVSFFLLTLCALKVPWVRLGTMFFSASILCGLSATYITRLLIAYYIPLALLIAFAIVSMLSRPVQKRCALILLVSMLGFNVYLLSHMLLLTSIKGLRVATGQVTPADYLKEPRNYYPNPSYGAYEFVRHLGLRSDDQILVAGESRMFYSPNTTVGSAPHDIPVIFEWAIGSKDPEELYRKLKSRNISIVIFNPAEARKIPAGYANIHLSNMIAFMLGHYFQRVYADPWAEVYRAKT